MGLPSGTFSRSISSALQISFSGQFDDGSDLGSTGVNSLVLQGTVTDGTTTRTVPLSLTNASAIVDWDYVAGSTLTCSMAVVSHTTTSTGYVSAVRLRIRVILMKR